MMHQAETMRSQHRLITVGAPTASGKTLGSLSRIVKSGTDAAIVLPTNELLEDQARSINQSLLQAGLTVTSNAEPTSGDESPPTERHTPLSRALSGQEKTDYAVLVVSGNRLAELAGQGSKGAALARMFAVNAKHVLLITNPDTIHLIFRARYARSGSILRELLRFKILVVDEFHLYHGTTLANLFFLLWELRNTFDQLIITTATPSQAIQRLEEFLHPHLTVSAQEASGDAGHMVRHPMRLNVMRHPQDHFLRDDRDLEIVVAYVDQLYERNRSASSAVKVLVIVNSIAFCIKLAQRLAEELGEARVSQVHSLVPSHQRRHAEVTVGTSALEVGIDFDVASILLEAGDAPAFIQRVGRAARHREAEGIAVIPSEAALYFKEHAPPSLTYSEMCRLAYAAMDEPRSYHEFLSSPECAELFAGFLYGMAHMAQDEYPNRTALDSTVNDRFQQPNFLDLAHLKNFVVSFPLRKMRTVAEAGFRGYLKSMPVYLERYNTLIRLGFFELPMLKVRRVARAEELDMKYTMVDSRELVLVVEDFVEQPYSLRMAWPNDSFKSIEHVSEDNARLDMANPGLSSIFFRLLDGLPAHATRRRPDWRLPAVKHVSRQEWLVIGLDAYLQAFLDHTAEGSS